MTREVQFLWLWAALGLILLFGGACTSAGSLPPAEPTVAAPVPTEASPSPTPPLPTPQPEVAEPDVLMPYPYTTPLPPPDPTSLDGTYVKVEPAGTPIPCRRCPDYKPEGGDWKLRFEKGVFRVLYLNKDWEGLGSFTVDGDQLILFNDPVCHDQVGRYHWHREETSLILEPIDDPCGIRGLRARNLAARPWTSCSPPNMEAAVTDHWVKPPGC